MSKFHSLYAKKPTRNGKILHYCEPTSFSRLFIFGFLSSRTFSQRFIFAESRIGLCKKNKHTVCLHLSLVVRKPAFCICKNKEADQLRDDREADQHLCFRYTDGTIPLLSDSEISSLYIAIFCGSTVPFVSDLVGNPEDRFSHNEAHFCINLFHKFLFLAKNCENKSFAKINWFTVSIGSC